MVEALEIETNDESTSNWFRSPPIQRQKWGDKQTAPHVNWGDMFFDLFYVAAAFNLSHIIKDNTDLIGFMYFLGCFLPVTNIWMNKMLYDGKFQLPDDFFHVGLEIVRLCLLATVVLHIRPVEYMSTGASNIEMFLFCVGVWSNALYDIALHLEIRFWGVIGEKGAKYSAMTSILSVLPSFLLITAALLYSLLIYINGESSPDSTSVHHAPVILMGISSFVRPAAAHFMIRHRGEDGENFKELTVPINVHYVIHRNAEWTMLMLGEGIMSLLIVPVEDEAQEFYITFFLGVVSVTFLQYLYFKSQPDEAEEHAMGRSRYAATTFTSYIQCYSAALVIVAVGFKMLLSEYKRDEDSRNSTYSTEDRRQRISIFFCVGLASVFHFLDLLSICHQGVEKIIANFRCPINGHIRWKGIFLVGGLRSSVIAFIGTACIYITEPYILAAIGLVSILLQIKSRVLAEYFFPPVKSENGSHSELHSHDEDHDQESMVVVEIDDEGQEQENMINEGSTNKHWPNVTQPAAIQYSSVKQSELIPE